MPGFQEGFNNATARLALFDYGGNFKRAYDQAREEKRVSGLRSLAGDYFAKQDPTLGEIARLGGDAAGMQRDMQATREQRVRELGQYAGYLASLPPQARSQAYVGLLPKLSPIGRDLGLPELPSAWDEVHLPELQALAKFAGASPDRSAQPMNVSPGGAVFDPTSRQEIYANRNFAPQKPLWDSQRGAWVIPPGQGGGSQQNPGQNIPDSMDAGGGLVQIAPPRPDYEAERLRLAQEASARAAQAAADAAAASRRASFGTAPPGQRFNDQGALEDIPGYRPKPPNADEAKGAAGAAGLVQDAVAYAASDTGVPAEAIQQMTPEQVRDLIKGKAVNVGGKSYSRQTRWMTGPVTGRIPGAGLFANADLEAYRSSAAGKQARVNNPTGPVTNADFEVGAKSVWGPDKPDEVNADLIYNALRRGSQNPATQPQPTSGNKAKEGDVVVNRQTGERLRLRNGKWERIQ